MIGHYPWTYQDGGRVSFKRPARPEHEEEHLYTEGQLQVAVAAERDKAARLRELVLELAEAVDNAADDIGGSRSQIDILRDAVRAATEVRS